jgi:hypothetical protein
VGGRETEFVKEPRDCNKMSAAVRGGIIVDLIVSVSFPNFLKL